MWGHFSWKSNLQDTPPLRLNTHMCLECGQHFSLWNQTSTNTRVTLRRNHIRMQGMWRAFTRKSTLITTRGHSERSHLQGAGEALMTKSTLVSHQRTHSGKNLSYAECGRRFSQKPNRFRHKRAHSGDSPFVYREYGWVYDKLTFIIHQEHAQGGKPHVQECGQGFGQAVYLIVSWIHSGEKP